MCALSLTFEMDITLTVGIQNLALISFVGSPFQLTLLRWSMQAHLYSLI